MDQDTPKEEAESETFVPVTAEDFKNLGNECVRAKNFFEAILHYSEAIKINPLDYLLFSNRSLAFLKTKQYYHAFQDAEQTINLNPNFGKGYFRKAEVQREIGQYDCALLSYGRALQLCPNDSTIITLARKTAALCSRETMLESRLPWVGAAIGLIFAIVIVICDHLFTKNPSIKHPVGSVSLVFAIAIVGYLIAKGCRYYIKLQRKGMIEPPADLLNESTEAENPEDMEEEGKQRANRTRYTKSQARFRFKKGKS